MFFTYAEILVKAQYKRKTPQATTSVPNTATMLRVGWNLPKLAFLCTVGNWKDCYGIWN